MASTPLSEGPVLRISAREIGAGRPCYIIAELSANHRQRLEVAQRTIEAAQRAGADAIKLQTYTPDTITIESTQPQFMHGDDSPWAGRTLHELYGEAYMPWEWHEPLQRTARDLGIDLFSTPFDPTAVDLLQALDMPAFKVASFEIVDIPLIERMARTGRPLIISTGMATLDEIEEAVRAARVGGAGGVALLKCTSAYPAPAASMNLRAIPHLTETFGVPAGLSDHTLDIIAPVVAVSLGACIVEKHLTLARADGGPDAAFSLEPHEFARMVAAVREAEASLGEVRFGTEAEAESRKFRRSLYAVADVQAGEALDEHNVRSIRPAGGLHPRHLRDVIGRRARIDLVRGTPLSWDAVE